MVSEKIQELRRRQIELEEIMKSGGEISAIQSAVREHDMLTRDIQILRDRQFLGEVNFLYRNYIHGHDGIQSEKISIYLRSLAYGVVRHVTPSSSSEEIETFLDTLNVRGK